MNNQIIDMVKISGLSKNGMWVSIIDITPELAVNALESNTKNRKIRESVVKKYMRDIAVGKWKMNGVSIVFNENGILLDGQHRLTAGIKTNSVLKNTVVCVVPETEGNGYDMNLTRSTRDIAFFENKTDKVFHSTLITSAVGIILGNKGISKFEILDTIEKYFEECTFVDDNFLRKGSGAQRKVKKAGTVAAILKGCICGQPYGKMKRFCDVLITGIVEHPEDIGVIKLRDYLLSVKSSGGALQKANLKHLHFPLVTVCKLGSDAAANW